MILSMLLPCGKLALHITMANAVTNTLALSSWLFPRRSNKKRIFSQSPLKQLLIEKSNVLILQDRRAVLCLEVDESAVRFAANRLKNRNP